MALDPWDGLGDAQMTEHWRAVVPALSVDPGADRSYVANDGRRAERVRRRYALELKHLTQTEHGRGFVTSRLTRVSDWSPLTDEERQTGRRGSPFVLCRGIPSGLSFEGDRDADEGLDFAIVVSVPPPFLPAGPLMLDGVSLVVHRFRPFRPLPGDAHELWPQEPAIPSYSR